MQKDWLEGIAIDLPDVTLRVYHRPAQNPTDSTVTRSAENPADSAANSAANSAAAQDKKWVIFYHGACGSKDLWRNQYDAFPDHNLLFVDIRGQGNSPMKDGKLPDFRGAINDLDAIYQHFGISKAILVGHSWGGNPMQEYTLHHPDRVAGLAIIGTWGQHRKRPKGEIIAQRTSALIYRLIPWGAMSTMSGKACSHDPAVQAEVADGIRNCGKATFLNLGNSAFKEVHDIDGYPGNPPMLLIRGSDDFPKSLSAIYEYIEDKNPNARQAIIDGVVHMPMLTAVETFNSTLQQFFDEVAVAAPR